MPAPPNDLCYDVMPETLEVGHHVLFVGDNTGATAVDDGVSGSTIGDAGLPTVWHAFELTSCSKVIVEYCGTTPSFGNYWNLLSTDCPSSTSINVAAFNDTVCGDGNRTMIFDPIQPGVYYLPVLNDPFNNAEGPYEIRVSALVCTGGTPPNDICSDVPVDTLFMATSIEFYGDNTGATAAGDGLPGSTIGDSNLPTVWHAFYLPSCSKVKVEYCGTTPRFQNYWNLVTMQCPSQNSIVPVSAVDTLCVDSNRTMIYDGLAQGRYYLPVLNDNFNNAEGPYRINVSATVCTGGTPPNDLCTDVSPLDLPLGTTIEFYGDNSGATSTNDGLPGSSIGDSNLPTVWHAFTTTDCANVRVTYCGTTPKFGNYWNLLSADCPSSTSINPTDLTDTICADSNRTLFYDLLPAGTYYLPVLNDPFNDAEGPYQVQVRATNCAGQAPENDLCMDVTPVQLTLGVPENFSGNNTGATATNDGVEGSVIGDAGLATVWHAFIINSCADVSVSYCNTNPVFGNYWNLLTTTCPADSSIFAAMVSDLDCIDGNRTIYYDSLQAGTYYIPVLMDPFNEAEGPYELEVLASSCSLTTMVQITQEENWTVYPNPSRGVINLMPRRTDNYTVDLIDLRGSLVYSEQMQIVAGNRVELDLRGLLVQGNYILKISDNSGRYIQKIIVE